MPAQIQNLMSCKLRRATVNSKVRSHTLHAQLSSRTLKWFVGACPWGGAIGFRGFRPMLRRISSPSAGRAGWEGGVVGFGFSSPVPPAWPISWPPAPASVSNAFRNHVGCVLSRLRCRRDVFYGASAASQSFFCVTLV